jgi:hypothetical protein
MRLSRLFTALAAAFSASAFAVAPPGAQGPRQDDSVQTPQSSTMSPSGDEAESSASSSEREGNAWLSSSPNESWQSSAQREAEPAQESDRTAMRGEPPLPAEGDASPAPLLVPERMPSTGEQS